MKLNFIYNVDSELDRVEDFLRRKDFFLEHGYIFALPEGLGLEGDNPEDLKLLIEKEISNPAIDVARTEIQEKWKQYGLDVINLLNSLTNESPSEIDVILTKYGCGGSYWPPQKVIINVNYEKYFENFTHELIHCCVEAPIVKKHCLTHRQKEGVVDWIFLNSPILKTIFPDYRQQKISIMPDERLIVGAGLYKIADCGL